MTGEAIDIFLGGKIEAFILPTVSNVTTHAAGVVRRHGNAEIVDDILLAKLLPTGWILVFPRPVLGSLNLSGRFGVAGKAGFCHFLRCPKFPLQLGKFRMICRRRQLHRLGIGQARGVLRHHAGPTHP